MQNNKQKQRKKKYSGRYYKKNRKLILRQKRKYWKTRRRTEKDKIKRSSYSRKYYKKHKIKILKRQKKYRNKHKIKIKKRMRKYNIKNKERIAKRSRLYNLKNKIALAKKRRENIKRNRIKIRKKQTRYQRLQRWINIQYKLSNKLRSRIKGALQGNPKVGSAIKELGCSVGVLVAYLQNKFYGKMTWNNWGKVWELDHITPFWKFDLTDPKQFKKAVHHTNLQPLTIKEHKKKTAKEASERRDLRTKK